MLRVAKRGVSALAYGVHKAAKNVSLRRMLFNSIRLKRSEAERFRSMEECRFLAYFFLNRHESKSQILQDLWVGYELGERRGGFFVEFGRQMELLTVIPGCWKKSTVGRAFWLSRILCGTRLLARTVIPQSIIAASAREREKLYRS